jgi:hypothetical protein
MCGFGGFEQGGMGSVFLTSVSSDRLLMPSLSQEFGEVKSARMALRARRSLGYGFVTMATAEAANAAVAKVWLLRALKDAFVCKQCRHNCIMGLLAPMHGDVTIWSLPVRCSFRTVSMRDGS